MTSRSAPALTYEFCALTDQGRVRANNEDAVLVDEALQLVLLADGMGGYNAGEVASSMATTSIAQYMAQHLGPLGGRPGPTEVRRALEAAVENANAAVLGASLSHSEYAGMGTTLVVAIFVEGRMILGHIGDSRAYLLRADALQQITRDHSWLQEQLDAGLMTPHQAALSGNRNLVTRALGVGSQAIMDVNEFQIAGQDLVLLCSDGLTDMISDADIAEILRTACPLPEKAQRLIDAANAQGGRDNVSVLLVLASESAKKRSLMSRWLGGR